MGLSRGTLVEAAGNHFPATTYEYARMVEPELGGASKSQSRQVRRNLSTCQWCSGLRQPWPFLRQSELPGKGHGLRVDGEELLAKLCRGTCPRSFCDSLDLAIADSRGNLFTVGQCGVLVRAEFGR